MRYYGALKSTEGKEEPLTDIFTDLGSKSLKHGPELLNALHKGELTFSETATIENNQRSRWLADGTVPDWIIRDEDTIVAYEAKRGVDIEINQLHSHFRQLRETHHNNIYLVVVTADRTPPKETLDKVRTELKTGEELQWYSWYEIGRKITDDELDIPDEHSITVDLLKDMVQREGFSDTFSGFDPFPDKPSPETMDRWYAERDLEINNLIRSVEQELEDSALTRTTSKRNYDRVAQAQKDPLEQVERASRRRVPRYYTVPFAASDVETNIGEWHHPHLGLLVHLHQRQVEVVFNTFPNEGYPYPSVIVDHADLLMELVQANSMDVLTSMNSHNHKFEGIERWNDSEEIHALLTNKERVGDPEESTKRIMLGYRMTDEDTDPDEFVQKIAERLQLLHDLFYVEHPELVNAALNE